MNLYLDDKKTTQADILAELGLKHVAIPNPGRVRKFERANVKNIDGQIKKDPQTKKPIVPSSLSFKNSFDAPTAKGGFVKITFSPRQSIKTVNGIASIKYDDENIDIPGLHRLVSPDQKNLFFFLYLHPFNRSSPLNYGKLNPRVEYAYLDEEGQAKIISDKEDEIAEAIISIKNLQITEVRQLAKGYNLTDNIDELTDAEVRNLLRDKAKKNPGEFLTDLDNNEVAFAGIIKDALDKEVIARRNSAKGIIWSIDGIDIADSKDEKTGFQKVLEAVQGQMDELMPRVLNNLKTAKHTPPASNPMNDKYFGNFKIKEDVVFDSSDAADIKEYENQEEHIGKLRHYASLDIKDPKLNANVKKALVKNAEAIETQRKIDKQEEEKLKNMV